MVEISENFIAFLISPPSKLHQTNPAFSNRLSSFTASCHSIVELLEFTPADRADEQMRRTCDVPGSHRRSTSRRWPRINDPKLQAGGAVPFVFTQAIGDVDGFPRLSGKVITGTKDHAAEHAPALPQPIAHAGREHTALANFRPDGDK